MPMSKYDEPIRKLIAEMPPEIVAELAILEDRAIRAEGKVARQAEQIERLQSEVAWLREALQELQELAQGLQTRAGEVAEAAAADARSIEDKLRHLLVIQAQ
jgi:predicted nuclease with TOPRIM domain